MTDKRQAVYDEMLGKIRQEIYELDVSMAADSPKWVAGGLDLVRWSAQLYGRACAMASIDEMQAPPAIDGEEEASAAELICREDFRSMQAAELATRIRAEEAEMQRRADWETKHPNGLDPAD